MRSDKAHVHIGRWWDTLQNLDECRALQRVIKHQLLTGMLADDSDSAGSEEGGDQEVADIEEVSAF